ncbi:Uncharacterized conserved protein YegP, UPF0339 family [Halomicrobium zhouii]|uniref:Uncharacterized conserved protein YegP, UPF0339 family n=2 Tax=Halomicrobium zhouii TaxID=767519 RepID=A0A1I6M731_9EURY|nr:HVO_2922 family protein [Halomicrobium zhouii]SFS11487.1 Uncharacterized conserved protein YegP, UPF0339 family [Halomicrobium zhouii]
MAMKAPGPLADWYQARIGTPSTGDEVLGYWIFSLGIILGTLGLVQFFFSPANSAFRMLGYLMGAVGLVALIIGPTIRLPLSRRATTLSSVGAVACLAAIAWFLLVYPGNWERPVGHVGVVSLYAAGLVLTAVGAVFAPILTGPRGTLEETTAAVEAAEAERDALGEDLSARDAALADVLADRDATAAELAVARETIAGHEESKAAFELYEDKSGQWRWRLRHRNTNIVADSGEGYASRQKAMQGLQSVRSNALGAAVTVHEVEADAVDEPPEILVAESQGTFEYYEDKGGQFRWRLRHDNGEVVADSGEGYASKSNVRRAMDTIRRVADGAVALEIDPVGFEVYADAGGQYRWRLLHRNGNILADSGEGYVSRSNARRAVDTVREVAADADNFDLYEDHAGETRWRLVAGNGETVADSGEGYASKSNAEDAVERVSSYAPEADALDVGAAAFEIYEDRAEEYRWRLRARNGETVADSGEGYSRRAEARAAVDRVKRHVPGADEESVEN